MKSILARPDEVRAFLAGRKTMIRRPVKMRDIGFIGGRGDENNPECWGYAFDGPSGHGWMVLERDKYERHNHGLRSIPLPCAPGDTVAVKETWASGDEMAFGSAQDPPQCIAYRADNSAVIFGEDLKARTADVSNWNWEHSCLKWKSPSHLPLWAVRLHLHVTAVKVERLQSISDADAMAEGCASSPDWQAFGTVAFQQHWDSHAKPGERWADSPWVAAYTVEVKHV